MKGCVQAPFRFIVYHKAPPADHPPPPNVQIHLLITTLVRWRDLVFVICFRPPTYGTVPSS